MTPIAAGGVPPFGQDMNGILNQITEVLQWQQAGGYWQFDANFAAAIGGYPLGAVLNSKVVLGREWMSTVDNNMTDPEFSVGGQLDAAAGSASGRHASAVVLARRSGRLCGGKRPQNREYEFRREQCVACPICCFSALSG